MQSPSLIHLSEAIIMGLCPVPAGSGADSAVTMDSVCSLMDVASASLPAVIVTGIMEGKPWTLITGPWQHVQMVALMPLSVRNDAISPHSPDMSPLSMPKGKYTLKCSKIPKNENLCMYVAFLRQRFVFLQNIAGVCPHAWTLI